MLLGKWGSEGSGPGQFNRPLAIAVAPDGTVYVTDGPSYRVQYFDASGTFLGTWGSGRTSDARPQFAVGIGVAPDGRTVYVAAQETPGKGGVQAFCMSL